MLSLLCRCSLLLLIHVFDLSLGGTLQLFSSPDTNESYCPGKVTFTCVGIDVPTGVGWRINGSIIYTYLFPNEGNEMFPEVVFTNNTITITVKSAVVNTQHTHNITIELTGNVSYLLQSTVSCRTFTQESESFFILLTVPEIPNITVYPVYNISTKTLSAINVLWNTSNGLCVDYSYQVMLTNGSSTLRSENVVCRRDTECQVTFMIMSEVFNKYIVEVVTLNFQGLAVNTSILPPIDYISSTLPNISVEFSTCFIRCYSDPDLSGTCKIDFLEGSVSGTVNSEDIQVPESLQPGTVRYNATFNVDGRTYTFKNSSDFQYYNKWTAGILSCVILTPVLCVLSIILIILFGVHLHKRKTDFRKYLGYLVIVACTILPAIIFLLVSLICWIAGLVGVSKTGNCSSIDMPQNILIAACIFSFLPVIFDVAAIALVHIYHSQTKKQHQSGSLETWQIKETQKNCRTDKVGVVDEHGLKEENFVVSGHRSIGEISAQARSRVAEQRTQDDGNEYDTTKFQTGGNQASGNIAGLTEGYASLDRLGKKASSNNGDYHHLSHDNHKQKSGGPVPSFSGGDAAYSGKYAKQWQWWPTW